MKLFERLRWLPTEMPWPGTADVSANSCVLRGVGRRHAGNEQRQIEEVAAVHRQTLHFPLRDRAGDLAARRFQHGACPVTVTLASTPATASVIGSSNADPTVSVSAARDVGKTGRRHGQAIRTQLEIGKPEAPFAIGRRFGRQIGVGLARGHRRPGHDAALLVGHPAADAGLVDGLLGGRCAAPRASSAHPAKSAMTA